MSNLMKCSRGHTWQPQGSAETVALTPADVCPYCGQPAVLSGAKNPPPSATVAQENPEESVFQVSLGGATLDGSGAPSPPPALDSRTQIMGSLEETPLDPTGSASEHTGEWTLPGSPGSAPPSSSMATLDLPLPESQSEIRSISEATVAPEEGRPSAVTPPPSEATVLPEEGKLSLPAAPKAALGGAQVAGYEILKELGRGAMGVVYKARQVALNRMVALKMMLASQHASAKALARFQIEAEAVARLQHPNIVQIYEIGEAGGCPYFSLEYVDGGTLGQRVGGQPMRPRDAAWVVQQLSRAMYSAHCCGIVHRDLKPENVLLTRGPATPDGKPAAVIACVPKVTDFGLAKQLENDSSQTHAGTIMGTPSYMAPEQAEGRVADMGPPADIYALGAILYDLLTGRPPFQGKTVLETLQQVKKHEPIPPRRLCKLPPDLDTICLKCLEKPPAKRYATAGDLADDLERFLAGRPIQARRTPAWEKAWKWCRRQPAAAALIGLFSLMVIGLVAGGVWFAQHEHYRAQEEAGLRQLAEQQRQLAVEQEQQKEKQRQVAEEQKNRAEQQRQRAEEQKRRAEQQHQLAEMRFGQAREAVDFMLTRVGQEKLEGEPRMEQVRRDLLEEALRFYERFLQQKTDSAVLRWQTAQAFRKAGNIRELLGKHQEAEKAYRSSLELFDALPALSGSQEDAPEPSAVDQERAFAWSDLGIVLLGQGQAKDADAAFQRGLELKEKLCRDFPDRPAFQRDLANSHNSLGTLLGGQRRFAESAAAYARACDLLEKLPPQLATLPECQQALCRAQVNWATALQLLGQAAEAEKVFRLVVARREQQAPMGLDKPDQQHERARNLFLLATLLQATPPPKGQTPQSRLTEAERLHRQAQEQFQKLVKSFPRVPDYRESLAGCLNNLGDLLQATKRGEEGLNLWQEGNRILGGLAQEYPQRPLYAQEQARLLHNQGIALSGAEKLKEAEAAHRQALAIREQLARDFEQEPVYRQDLASSHGELAIVLAKRNQLDASAERFRQAIALTQQLSQQHPGRTEYWIDELVYQDNYVRLLQAIGMDREAKQCEKRMAELKDKLAKAGIKP